MDCGFTSPSESVESSIAIAIANVRNIGDVVMFDAISPDILENVVFEVEEPNGERITLETIFFGLATGFSYHWGAYFAPTVGGEHVARVYADDVIPAEAGFSIPRPRGNPREQYERTYVLLPPSADSSWARAVVCAAWNTRRFTIGGSADDAGIGDLDYRCVIAVNPHLWNGDLWPWFDEHYPVCEQITIEAATAEELQAKLEAIV